MCLSCVHPCKLEFCFVSYNFSSQCRPSKGRRRGYCWCVDKYGQPLPGFEGTERGETQCYNLENKWEDKRDAQWTERGQRIWVRVGEAEKRTIPTSPPHVVLYKHLKGPVLSRGRGPDEPLVLQSQEMSILSLTNQTWLEGERMRES